MWGKPLKRTYQLRRLARYAGVRLPFPLSILRELRQLIQMIQALGGFAALFLILGNLLAVKTIAEGVAASSAYWESVRLQRETETTRLELYQALRESDYEKAVSLRAKYTRLTGGD